jgi:hypothetical protein
MESFTDELRDLRRRVKKLEKRHALWRLILVFVLAAFLIIDSVHLLHLFNASPSITTHNLTIVDDQGKARAYLNYNGHGTGLVLRNAKGEVQASLTVADTGFASLSLHDRNGANKIDLGTNPDSTSFLALNGKTRHNHSLFAILVSDSAYIKYRNADSSATRRWP